MTIRTVFFDFGNVLATFDFDRFFKVFAQHTGVKESTVREAVHNGMHGYSTLMAQFERGEITPPRFFHLLTTTLGCTNAISYSAFRRYWLSVFLEENMALDSILSRVTAQKFMLSNTNQIAHGGYIAECALIRKHFPVPQRIMSYRVGAIKPDQKIFMHALSVANTLPKESVFIDDVPANIETWESFGGIGILYNAKTDSITNLEARLTAVGVLA